jgi:hypothetical protein
MPDQQWLVQRTDDSHDPRALHTPSRATRPSKLGACAEPAAPERNTPERLAVFLAAEREKWGAVIRKAHIRLE